jgi:phage gp16-like protein
MSALEKHYRQLLGIAKGWAAKNIPGWDDDCHRDLLSRHGAQIAGGRVSATTMSVKQISAVLADYERRGWPREHRFAAAGGATKSVPPRIALLVRLWGKLGQAGKVKSPTRPSLLAFCARQTGRDLPDLDSLSVAECQSLTEALKSWLGRGV